MSVTYLSVLSDQNKSLSFLNVSFMFDKIHSLPDLSLTYLLTCISVLNMNRKPVALHFGVNQFAPSQLTSFQECTIL